MAFLVMIIRKMMNNKWLELSLLIGLIFSVTLVSSMPIYTDAILQRMLVQDLQNREASTQEYSGFYGTIVNMSQESLEERETHVKQIDQYMEELTRTEGLSLPIIHAVQERSTIRYDFLPADPETVDPSQRRYGNVAALSDLANNIRLIDGRMPAQEPVDGVYEALVFPITLSSFAMVLGNEFQVEHRNIEGKITVKPVGVMEPLDEHNLYFNSKRMSNYRSAFFIPIELFDAEFLEGKKAPTRSANWYFSMDYSSMHFNDVARFRDKHEEIKTYIQSRFKDHYIESPILSIMDPYFEREQRLRTMLWSLNVPVMIMLGFYLFMVANLITSRQKTEIAVFRSRGASRTQIMMTFIAEGVLLGSIALLVGPQLGMLLTQMLGASNGFLEFVQRSTLQVSMTMEAYRYAFIAVVLSLVMTLIPAFMATRSSIVDHKRQTARAQEKSIWHKYFFDIILLVISVYGLFNFHQTMEEMLTLGIDSSSLRVDPMLFLIPALFILGMGLFILRVYPLFISLVYRLGRKWWSPSLYSTLIQVSRSSKQYQFIMVFLTITMATGLFSASAARTLNQNLEDQILYAHGADLTLQLHWESDAPPPSAAPTDDVDESVEDRRAQYAEPPFLPFTELTGIESAAKVFLKHNANFYTRNERGIITLIGIDTDEFGRTSWMRDRLLNHHFFEYLNLIAPDPTAVLISRTMAEEKGIKEGDMIHIGWSGLSNKPVTVYGIVDFFPTFNPNAIQIPGSTEVASTPLLVVAHLEFIQNNLALEPYEVWLKLDPDASREELYEELSRNHVPILSMNDTRGELIKQMNDPFQLAMNGVMTLGFLISVIITFIGFLLYWTLSLKSRIVQFGVLRAMGISFRQLIGMLVIEQILTSGAAIVIGAVTGHVTSRLFVPLFQMTFNPATQVPPFEVFFQANDAVNLYSVVSLMIIIGLCILAYMVSRIKIHQAIKLGED